jgi:hypothetical protein
MEELIAVIILEEKEDDLLVNCVSEGTTDILNKRNDDDTAPV